MKKRSELLFSLILVPIDYLMMIAGFVMAYFVRVGEDRPLAFPIGGRAYLGLMLTILPIWILIFALMGLYSMESNRGRLREIVRIGAASLAGTMVIIMLDFFNYDPVFPSKSIPVIGFAFAFLFIVLARLIIGTIQKILFRFGVGVHTVLLLGQTKLTDQLKVADSRYSGLLFLNNLENFSMPTSTKELEQLRKRHGIDEIVQVMSGRVALSHDEIIDWCHQHHVGYSYIPSVTDTFHSNVRTGLFLGVPTIQLQQTPLDGWGRIVKRIVDIITSFFALLILSPIFAIIALLVKITDPSGPIFFSHTRLSRTGKKMKVYKFRSMKWRYSEGPHNGNKSAIELIGEFGDPQLVEEFRRTQKLKNDPRITKLGRFLRSTSLDELPQFYNVLVGDLSLVGPRPIVEAELERYGKRSGAFLSIRPGLTGLWQVSGRNDVSYAERVKLDIYYVENWSLLMDLTIIFKTVVMLLKGRSGY